MEEAMSDSHDYSQRFEQPGGPQQAEGAPPPGPPPSQPMAYSPPQGRKSQALAGILSGVFPGLGNIYVGFATRGFVQAGVTIFCIVALSTDAAYGVEPLFGVFLGFWWFYGIIDAVRRAGALNLHLAGVQPMNSLPEDLEIPSRGSKGWGLASIIVGGIFLLNTTTGFSLEWLEDWWPLLLIGFGAWLYWKARKVEQERPSNPNEGGGFPRSPRD